MSNVFGPKLSEVQTVQYRRTCIYGRVRAFLSTKYLGKFFVNSHPDQENGDILLIYLCTFRVDQNLQKYEHVVIRQIFINSGTAIR